MSIQQDFLKLGRDAPQIIRHKQRRRHHRPKSKLSSCFVDWETKVSDDNHVRVKPLTWSMKPLKVVLILCIKVNDAQNWRPGIHDVVIVSPQVAVLCYGLIIRSSSFSDNISRPWTRVKDWSLRVIQSFSQTWVHPIKVSSVCITSVHFERVNIPFCKGLRIQRKVVLWFPGN